eukprot:scaffold54361_cov81-Phaeocystis_antarctica.AAC.1
MACRDKLRRKRRDAHRISTRIRIGCSVERIAATGCLPICLPRTLCERRILSEDNNLLQPVDRPS